MKRQQLWTDLDISERQVILENVREKRKLDVIAIEKDFWVSMVLKALFSLPAGKSIVFKGGTSLSKGWNLIDRFSEDIDLAIDREFFGFAKDLGKNQRDKLRKTSKKYIEETLAPTLANQLGELGVADQINVVVPPVKESDKDPVELFIEYKSVLPSINPYINKRVKLEISCRSMREPFKEIPMRSMIAEEYADESLAEAPFLVPTVLPGRTFLEKVFLLHEEFQKENPRSYRMSRHLYDIEKLMRTAFGSEALHDRELYDTIVHHRSTFNNIKGLDYSLHAPQTICFLPPERVYRAWKDDYEAMCKDFIFEKSPLPFDDLLQQIEILQNRIRTL